MIGKYFVILMTMVFVSCQLSALDRPPRRIAVDSRSTVTATGGSTEIVIDASAPRTVRFAAGELKSFLGLVFGCEIPVVHTVSPGKISLILGERSWSAGHRDDLKNLHVRDSFCIRRIGRKIYIAGRDDPGANIDWAIEHGGVWSALFERATLFGVYDFLARFAGVRMYFPGELGTVVPRTKALIIPEINIYDRPDFTQRRVYMFGDGLYFEGKNRKAVINPYKNLNYYRLRLETDMIPSCHGTIYFQYIQRFGKTHPEYFALFANGARSNNPDGRFPGQLCWSSGITEEMYQDVRSYLKGEDPSVRGVKGWGTGKYSWGPNCRGGKYVDIMPQDSFTACQCAKCQSAYRKGDPSFASELLWGNVVSIARRLKAEKIPGNVVMMAYSPYRRIPAIDIPDNVQVMVAETGPWALKNTRKLSADNEEIKNWSRKLGHKVWIWTYPGKLTTLTMPGIPQMAPRAYAQYYQSLVPWIFGAFAESESDRFLYNYLNYYIFSRIAWDNKARYEEILDEHYRLMFGAAASVMQKYYELLEDLWIGRISGRVADTALGPVGSPPSDYDLWNSIYTPEVIAGMDRMLVGAAGKVPANSLESRRIALIRREFYDPLCEAARKYREMSASVNGLKFHIGSEPGGKQYLLPFYPQHVSKARQENWEKVETSVEVWKTADKLGIRFVCEEPQMKQMATGDRKPDDPEIWKDNSVEIFLNPSGDRRTYYQLIVNSDGRLSDQKIIKAGAKGKGDFSWNSHAEVQIARQTAAWIATVLIPLEKMEGIRQEFPANFCRSRILNNGGKYHMLYQWSPFVSDFHDLQNYGSVVFGKEGNLLINGNFSMKRNRNSNRHWGVEKNWKWVGGWIADSTCAESCSMDKREYVSYPQSLKMEMKAQSRITNYFPALKSGAKYRLSFYVKLKDLMPVKTGGGLFYYVNLGGKNHWFKAGLTGTMDWVYRSYEFKVPEAGAKNGNDHLSFAVINAGGTAWIDNVTLVEIPEK